MTAPHEYVALFMLEEVSLILQAPYCQQLRDEMIPEVRVPLGLGFNQPRSIQIWSSVGDVRKAGSTSGGLMLSINSSG